MRDMKNPVTSLIDQAKQAARLFIASRGDLQTGLLLWKVRRHTMVPAAGLRNICDLARAVERAAVPGAFVECGVWRGGCSGVAASVARSSRFRRQTWLFDSFEGLPEPTTVDGEDAADYAQGRTGGELTSINRLVASEWDVHDLFRQLGIDPDRYEIRRGWFQDTLPACRNEIGPIALLRVDGDWYESTKVALENFFDHVVAGGYVVIDDYGWWEGCRRAVDEFLQARGLHVELVPVGKSIRFFQKSAI